MLSPLVHMYSLGMVWYVADISHVQSVPRKLIFIHTIFNLYSEIIWKSVYNRIGLFLTGSKRTLRYFFPGITSYFISEKISGSLLDDPYWSYPADRLFLVILSCSLIAFNFTSNCYRIALFTVNLKYLHNNTVKQKRGNFRHKL